MFKIISKKRYNELLDKEEKLQRVVEAIIKLEAYIEKKSNEKSPKQTKKTAKSTKSTKKTKSTKSTKKTEEK